MEYVIANGDNGTISFGTLTDGTNTTITTSPQTYTVEHAYTVTLQIHSSFPSAETLANLLILQFSEVRICLQPTSASHL